MQTVRKVIFRGLLILCLFPLINPPVALLLGTIVGLVIGNPFVNQTQVWSRNLLKLSVIGLGFGITAQQIGSVGVDAAVYTAIGISAIFIAGMYSPDRFESFVEQVLVPGLHLGDVVIVDNVSSHA